MDQDIAKQAQRILQKQGIKFKLSTKVVKGDDSGDLISLNVESTKNGKAETVGLLYHFSRLFIPLT